MTDVRVPDLPDLGEVTDASVFVGDHEGTGTFLATAIATYVTAAQTALDVTFGSLNVTNDSAFHAGLGIDGNLTVNGSAITGAGLQVTTTLDVGGEVGFHANLGVDGTVTATDGYAIADATMAFYIDGSTDRYLQFYPGDTIYFDHSTGDIKTTKNGVGEVMRLASGSGSLLVKGGPTTQIGTFGADEYMVLNGDDGFSSGAGGASSLIINGGGRATYGFEFYSNGTRVVAFDFDGDAYKPGGGSFSDISDERIKDNVADYAAGLDEIVQLRPVSYTFKPETGRNPNITHYGLIAQEAELVMPELVSITTPPWGTLHMQGSAGSDERWDDLRVLDPSALVFALINAVKELTERVEALEGA